VSDEPLPFSSIVLPFFRVPFSSSIFPPLGSELRDIPSSVPLHHSLAESLSGDSSLCSSSNCTPPLRCVRSAPAQPRLRPLDEHLLIRCACSLSLLHRIRRTKDHANGTRLIAPLKYTCHLARRVWLAGRRKTHPRMMTGEETNDMIRWASRTPRKSRRRGRTLTERDTSGIRVVLRLLYKSLRWRMD
jgi:hypothetical protein